MTLIRERNKLIQRMVKSETALYIAYLLDGRIPHRPCCTCGKHFRPIRIDHFFCSGECRYEWYRGMFRPRD